MSKDFIEGYLQRGKRILKRQRLYDHKYLQKLEEVKKVEDDLNEKEEEKVTEESEEYEYYYDRK